MPIYTKFSPDQLKELKVLLESTNYYPSKRKIKETAKSMRLPVLKIENWFKYNRRKMYFKGEFSEYKLRKSFRKEELAHLIELYEKNSSPSFVECVNIAKEMEGITPEQIKNWFANQRRKIKNNSLKELELAKKEKRKDCSEESTLEGDTPWEPSEQKISRGSLGVGLEGVQDELNLFMDQQRLNQILNRNIQNSAFSSLPNSNFIHPLLINYYNQPCQSLVDMNLYNYYCSTVCRR